MSSNDQQAVSKALEQEALKLDARRSQPMERGLQPSLTKG
jgi:hypothetical protein